MAQRRRPALASRVADQWLNRVLWRAAYKLRAASSASTCRSTCPGSPGRSETPVYKPQRRPRPIRRRVLVRSLELHPKRRAARVPPPATPGDQSDRLQASPEGIPDPRDCRPDPSRRTPTQASPTGLAFPRALARPPHPRLCAHRPRTHPRIRLQHVRRSLHQARRRTRAITGDYIDYCREDVAATQASRPRPHRVRAPPHRSASHPRVFRGNDRQGIPRGMGVTPPARAPQIGPQILGWAMSAYYGGRTEVRHPTPPDPRRLPRLPLHVPHCVRPHGRLEAPHGRAIEISMRPTA